MMFPGLCQYPVTSASAQRPVANHGSAMRCGRCGRPGVAKARVAVAKPMHVAICGAGVIGACTAYYLARRGIDVTVVEGTDVAAAASGKAGGFLALDWCAGTPLDVLARRSFELHAALAGEVAG